MAITSSPRLGLTRWDDDLDEWEREDFDGDNATLDNLVGIDRQGTLAARPSAGTRGTYYYAEDVDQLYRDTGTRWMIVGNVPIGAGIEWFIPNEIPPTFARPEGQELSRTIYADLFDLWGTFHGAGDGLTTFNMPNIKGRSRVSRDTTQPEFVTIGKKGGAKTHTLSIAEMPSHTHTIPFFQGNNSAGSPGVQGTQATATTTTPAGGDQPHNNLSPYYVGDVLIRVI